MDIIKHASVFEPSRLTGPVAIIGVGALGSALAIQLAKLGINNIELFDDDRVEAHNLPNQILYGPNDVGAHKVKAAASAIKRLTGLDAYPVIERVNTRAQIDGIKHLFVCVDSMDVRMQLYDRVVRGNPDLIHFCEGRMGARDGTVSSFDPRDLVKSREYRRRLYPDSEVTVERGACGNILSIGATAMSLACAMTWDFINRFGAVPNVPWDEISYSPSQLAVHHAGPIVAADD